MTKILGLDLGTNSIGWAVTDTAIKTIDAGVTTFQQGVNIKKDGSNEEPLNVAKRKARQQKRQVFYKDYRLTKMTEILARFGMYPFLKSLANPIEAKKIIAEINQRYNLNEQQLKNYKLNKYKNEYQLNARIAKLILLHGIAGSKPMNIDFEKKPTSLDDFINYLVAFISIDPYRLRSIALTDNISKTEFGRILYQFGKRRGFKSSRKVKNKDENEDSKFQEKTFKKNDKKKNWEEEIKKIRERYPDDTEIVEDTDEFRTIKFPKKLSEFYAGIEKTKEKVKEYKTLGNYLFHKNSHEERIRLETRADRAMYYDEFTKLWEKHAEKLGLNVLSGEKRKRKKEKVEVSLQEFLGDKRKGILFYQRPLKSQKHLVAICNFSNNPRCLISHPLFEQFRALQQINNLKLKRFAKWETLSPDERNTLINLFTTGCNETGKISITKAREALGGIGKDQLKGAAESDIENWEEEAKNSKKKKKDGSFSGNYSMFKLSKLFGEKWHEFNSFPKHTTNRIINSCKNDLGGKAVKHDSGFQSKSKEERKSLIIENGQRLWDVMTDEEKNKSCIERIQEEIWHSFSFYEDEELLFEKLNKDFGLEVDKKDELKTINLKSGYGSFSLKTIHKLIPFMERGVKQTDAIFLANIDAVFGKEKWGELSSANKMKIYDEVTKLVLNKQIEKKEIDLLNATIKDVKIEAEKMHEKFPKLNEEYLKHSLREKLTGFLKDEKEILEANEIDKEIAAYFERTKKLSFVPAGQPTEDVIKEYLVKSWSVDEKRLEYLWHPAKVEQIEYSPEELQEPKFTTLRNPIVKQALYALRTAIKAIEKKHGKPDIVRIELARELNDKNKRIAIRKWQKRKEDENNKAKDKLAEYSGVNPNNAENILKYKLWVELQENKGTRSCPYTGKPINFNDLFYDNKFQVEHIIPRSRCWSDAEINLTLCDVAFNGIKNEFTPFEIKDNTTNDFNQNWFQETKINKDGKEKTYWHYRPLQGWRQKADDLSKQIEQLEEIIKSMNLGDTRDKKIQDKYLLKYERDYFSGKYRRFVRQNLSKELDDDDDTLKSLITDTSYITKLAAQYLKSYYGEGNVETVKGATTAMLREEWDLGGKDRSKHYHHAEDAILITFTDRKLYQNLAQHRKKEKELGKFYHPWGINEFKDRVAKAVYNIAVYDKQRSKKITKYKKTIQLRGKKRKVNIVSVRGELHEPNPSGQVRFENNTYTTHRYNVSELSNKDWSKNIPISLQKSWVPLEPKTDKKTLKKVKLINEGKDIALSKLKFSDVLNIENEDFRELIIGRLKEKGLDNNVSEDLIHPGTLNDITYQADAKGGELKACKVTTTKKGKEKEENRKLSKGKWNLKFSEISVITDEVIKESIKNRLLSIVPDKPENTEDEIKDDSLEYKELFEEYKKNLKDEKLAIEQTNKFIRAVWQDDSKTLDGIGMPDIFFEIKIYRGQQVMGIPINKVTFIERDEKGHRIRKQIENITIEDIPHISEPAQSIIRERLKELKIEVGLTGALPSEFFKERIYVPVKNVRTHTLGGDLYEIRKGNFYRFGNIDHAILYQDSISMAYYLETVPFYFTVNPKKYDTNSRIFQGIGKTDDFKIEKLKEIEKFRMGDYFVLFKQKAELNKIIDDGKYTLLRENLYKVSAISGTSFDVIFRKHYAAKAKSEIKEENKHIQSSIGWIEANPLKVTVSATGKIDYIK